MQSPAETPVQTFVARRKLVRGAFSVPAVITLVSGGPAAAASSGLHCVNFQAQAANVQQPADGIGTNLMVRVPYYKQSAGLNYYIKGSELHSKKIIGTTVHASLATSTGWQQITTVATPASITAGALTSSDPILSATASGNIVIRYDAFGNIVGIGTGNTGTALYGTCWLSAYPGI